MMPLAVQRITIGVKGVQGVIMLVVKIVHAGIAQVDAWASVDARKQGKLSSASLNSNRSGRTQERADVT